MVKINKKTKRRIKVIRSKTNRRAPKISREKRNEMLEVYLSSESTNHVAKTCNIHYKTAKRYKEIDKWEEAYEQQNKRLRRRIVTNRINRTSRNIKVLDDAIESIVKKIKKLDRKGRHVSPMMLDKVIKLQEEILRSNPDEAEDQVVPDEVHKALQILAEMDDKDMKSLGDYLVLSNQDLINPLHNG